MPPAGDRVLTVIPGGNAGDEVGNFPVTMILALASFTSSKLHGLERGARVGLFNSAGNWHSH